MRLYSYSNTSAHDQFGMQTPPMLVVNGGQTVGGPVVTQQEIPQRTSPKAHPPPITVSLIPGARSAGVGWMLGLTPIWTVSVTSRLTRSMAESMVCNETRGDMVRSCGQKCQRDFPARFEGAGGTTSLAHKILGPYSRRLFA